MMTTAAAALILYIAVPAMSQTTETVEVGGIQFQVGAMADAEDVVQWKVLAARNGIDSKKKLRETARENLVDAKRLRYKFQRVEVSGVAAIDDTDEALPGMIDKQIKTSNLNDLLPGRSPLLNALRSYYRKYIDLKEAMSDTQGKPTERAQAKIDELKNTQINELFAHSWGTEVVYLGILNGDIIPPKKLVVMGVPEANEEKWLMLAKYTGIEVHVVGFEWDKAKITGNAATRLKSGLPRDTAGLEKLWRERCMARGTGPACADPDKFVRTKFDYDVHVRPPDVPKGDFINGHMFRLDHEKALYYTHLSNRGLFNKTIALLDAPQLKLIKKEENRILAEAMAEARSMIADAVAAAKTVSEDETRDRRSRFWESGNLSEFRRKLNELKELPAGPVAAVPNVSPQAANPGGRSVISFSRVLPKVKDFAVASCLSPGQVPLTEDITRPNENIFFLSQADDKEADRLSVGLGSCELRLFRRLIEVIRLGKGPGITNQWMASVAGSYRTPAVSDDNRATVSPPREPQERPRERECIIDELGHRICTVD